MRILIPILALFLAANSWAADTRIYLIQHAKKVDSSVNEKTPLSEEDVIDAEKTFKKLRDVIRVDAVFHSKQLRAKQTAAILSESIKRTPIVHEVEYLEPGSDIYSVYNLIKIADKDVAFVGHLPHLNRLASVMLGNSTEDISIKFKNAGVVCLVRKENSSSWALEWNMTPDVIRALE